MLFDFATVGPQVRYKLLGATITPRPIAWVSSLDEAGHLNAAPFSFFNAVSEDPPVIAFSILSRSFEDKKDTGRNVRIRREFVVNLVSEDTLEKMNITAIDFEAGADEFAEAGLTPASSAKIKTPRIAESLVSLECRLMEIIEIGSMRSLVLGEVLAMHIADEAVRDAERGYIDTPALRLIGRAGPNSYVPTSRVISLSAMTVEQWRLAKTSGV
jgi:flavin reductase (DIM6/NTAB) family NADH-FMN oxidoreductase RutF